LNLGTIAKYGLCQSGQEAGRFNPNHVHLAGTVQAPAAKAMKLADDRQGVRFNGDLYLFFFAHQRLRCIAGRKTV
jgi:hypothetical protein